MLLLLYALRQTGAPGQFICCIQQERTTRIVRLCRTYQFGNIDAYRLGWSLAGPPMMTTHFFTLGNVMIDTGQAHMEKEAIGIAEQKKIRKVFLTHHHEDHTGNAAAVKTVLDAEVFGHELTIKKMARRFNILPYQKYVWGKSTPLEIAPIPEIIDTELGEMTAIHTPGHSKDHTAYFIADTGILFSGDLYLSDRIKYFRADEDMGSQIGSLKNILHLDFDMLLCSHFPKLKNGKTHIRNKLQFLEELYGNIIDSWEKGYPEKQILKKLGLKEQYFVKYFCFGNVSMLNGIRSAIRYHTSREKLTTA